MEYIYPPTEIGLITQLKVIRSNFSCILCFRGNRIGDWMKRAMEAKHWANNNKFILDNIEIKLGMEVCKEDVLKLKVR